MKKINILYWTFTILFGAFMLSTAIPSQEGTDFITKQMGYPVYFVSFIAVAKLLGVIGILVPGFPRVKEWAYAGLFFDLVSAVYSFIALGMIEPGSAVMLVPFILGIGSYIFYHKRKAMLEQTLSVK